MIYVYTCILGGFDNLRPPLVDPEPGVRFVCFTDCPVLPSVAPWEFRPVHRVYSADMSGRTDMARTSRLPKILPHLMLPADADYSIWIDGNFQLRKPASEIINEELRTEDWAVHQATCGARTLVLDATEWNSWHFPPPASARILHFKGGIRYLAKDYINR